MIIDVKNLTSADVVEKMKEIRYGTIPFNYLFFQLQNGVILSVNVRFSVEDKTIEFYTKDYGRTVINFAEKKIHGVILDIDLNRVLLMSAKTFAMFSWFIKFEELRFITAKVLFHTSSLHYYLSSYQIEQIIKEPQRYEDNQRFVQIAFEDDQFVVGLSSYSHYMPHFTHVIAKISSTGYDVTITAKCEEDVKLALKVINAIIERK